MKKVNSTLGVISVIILIIGIFFKLNSIRFAGELQCLGALGLIAFFITYLIIGIKPLTTALEKSVGVVGALAMCISVAGVAFKTMHWPGAGILVWLSQLGLLLTSVLLIIDSIIEKDQAKQSIKTLFAFALIILTSILFFAMKIIASRG